MFSDRLPRELAANRLTAAIEAKKAAGVSFVDLTISNPTAAGIEYPADVLAPLADSRGLRYDPSPFGSREAREAVAADYARRRLVVAPEHIALTASTSEAYALLFKLLADAGDEVLVPRPSYPLFDFLTRLELAAAVPYALEYHGRWSIDLASVEAAIGPRTRAILLVSPNNPTGSYITRSELDRLSALCAPRGIAIVADEVFADYELEPGSGADAGHPATRDDVLSFSLGGLSKSVGLPQVKVGWIFVAGPDPLVRSALQRLEIICDTYLSVSTPAQIATAELLRTGAIIRDRIAERVRRNYEALRSSVRSMPACTVLRSDGGWHAVLQVPTFESEEALVLRLLDAGVLIHPGFFFDFARESFLVVSLLGPEAAFDDGMARVFRHFACTRPPLHNG